MCGKGTGPPGWRPTRPRPPLCPGAVQGLLAVPLPRGSLGFQECLCELYSAPDNPRRNPGSLASTRGIGDLAALSMSLDDSSSCFAQSVQLGVRTPSPAVPALETPAGSGINRPSAQLCQPWSLGELWEAGGGQEGSEVSLW